MLWKLCKIEGHCQTGRLGPWDQMCWCGSCNEFFPPHHQHEMNCGNMVVWRPISLNRRLIALHYTYGMCIIVSIIMLITQLGFLIRRLFQPWRWKFIHLLQSKKKLSNPVNAAHPYKHICSGLLFFLQTFELNPYPVLSKINKEKISSQFKRNIT